MGRIVIFILSTVLTLSHVHQPGRNVPHKALPEKWNGLYGVSVLAFGEKATI